MLESLLSAVQRRDHRFTFYRSGDPPAIESWLADRGVTLDSRSLPPGGPASFIEIKTDGEFVGVIGVEALDGLLEPPIVRPGEQDGVSEGYRVLFTVLDEILFSGMTRRELLAVSREIEDRVYRVGKGTLRVSFQTLSTFRSQVEIYRTLATETAVEIHIYGVGDWDPPEITGITYHGNKTETLERYWALAFDGGTFDTQACGLVAEERSNGYSGFWTDDPRIVGEISAALTRQ